MLDGTATGYACTNNAVDVDTDYFQIEHKTSFPFGDALVHLTSIDPGIDNEYFLPALVYVGPEDTPDFAVECGRLPGHEPIDGTAIHGQTFVVRCPLSEENNAVKITRDIERMSNYNANTSNRAICIGNVHICQDVFIPPPPYAPPAPPFNFTYAVGECLVTDVTSGPGTPSSSGPGVLNNDGDDDFYCAASTFVEQNDGTLYRTGALPWVSFKVEEAGVWTIYVKEWSGTATSGAWDYSALVPYDTFYNGSRCQGGSVPADGNHEFEMDGMSVSYCTVSDPSIGIEIVRHESAHNDRFLCLTSLHACPLTTIGTP